MKRPRRRQPRASRNRRSGSRIAAGPQFFEDFVDLPAALNRQRARFLVVGAYAMAAHGVPGATGDFDVWVEPGRDNAARVELLEAQARPRRRLPPR